MTTLFINIKELIQVRETSVQKVSGEEMKELPTIKNAFLLIENELIVDYGSMDALQSKEVDEVIDATGKIILPTWCDSHTHLVFASTREGEFVDRINGLTYEEIAEKGGGILNSAKKLQNTSEEDLYKDAEVRLQKVIKMGTGAIEIKSGYGLSVEAELKMLRVVKRLKENYNIPIKATFLGAHAIPAEYKSNREAYIEMIINEMIPLVIQEGLADYIDVFCEKGYYTPEETDRILKAGKEAGLIPKVHVNQFNSIGGIATCVENKALSVDHLEVITDADIDQLKGSNTMPVALPSCSFFLGIPYTDGRKLISHNLPLALATDYNPGSTPSGNMNFVVSLACIRMKLTPEEAINAATINGAYALNLEDQIGSITRGKLANFMVTETITSYNFIPYNFGSHTIEDVYIKGIRM
ncbi:imidazolonepropionase [Pseudotenacibaculum haliotis]|uniref:Imidazolonepropionase n=1 Tax=Pseudotenacibaculum haliotis TaxID=1862138 RepID=A0ABW5LTQ0_9FLAO